MKPVATDIVTGFLGAGKTTLLRHVLDGALAGERVAVIVNELGDVAIDGRAITGLENVEKMVELESGCICCTIDDYRFDQAIAEIVATADPTLVVIETTGVAEPEPLLERAARAGLALDAVITVVDAAHLDEALRASRATRAQIAAADFLVVNKTDLANDRTLAKVRRRLARINRRALVTTAAHGRVASDLLFATAARRFRQPAAGGAAAHLSMDAIGAFSYRSAACVDKADFERFLAQLPPSIYRAKGVVRFAGNPWACLFSYACGRYELNWIQLGHMARGTEAVFIGREVDCVREEILARLADCERATD